MKKCKINPAKPEFKHAKTIWKLIDKGLSNGLGKPIPGQMCVEALVSYVMGEPHGDDPTCVLPVIAGDKININDADGWSSSKARARGIKGFAIAQLGTRGMSSSKYKKLLSDELIREFYPNSSDAILFIENNVEVGLNDKTLTAICECGVRALTKMGSPGSKWLKKLRKG